VTGAHVSCSPGALPAAVVDLCRAVFRLAPGLLDARIRPALDAWDLARWLAHGRLRMEVCDVRIHASVAAASRADALPFGGGSLRHFHGGGGDASSSAASSAASPSSVSSPAGGSSATGHHDASGSNAYNSVSISVARVKIAYENSSIRVSTLRTDLAIGSAPRSVTAGAGAVTATIAPFMTLPRVDVAIGLHWQSGSGRPDLHTVYPIGSLAEADDSDDDNDHDNGETSFSSSTPAPNKPLLPGDYQTALNAAARRALIDVDAIQRDCAQPRWMARLWTPSVRTSSIVGPTQTHRRLEIEDGAALPIEARMFWAKSDAEFARHFHSRAHATIEHRWYVFAVSSWM
jgi:hypothetical protein